MPDYNIDKQGNIHAVKGCKVVDSTPFVDISGIPLRIGLVELPPILRLFNYLLSFHHQIDVERTSITEKGKGQDSYHSIGTTVTLRHNLLTPGSDWIKSWIQLLGRRWTLRGCSSCNLSDYTSKLPNDLWMKSCLPLSGGPTSEHYSLITGNPWTHEAPRWGSEQYWVEYHPLTVTHWKGISIDSVENLYLDAPELTRYMGLYNVLCEYEVARLANRGEAAIRDLDRQKAGLPFQIHSALFSLFIQNVEVEQRAIACQKTGSVKK